jgi:hypothetical protein
MPLPILSFGQEGVFNMSVQQWDIKLWIITILVGISISIGTYNLKSISAEVEGVKARADALSIRQAVDDERFIDVKQGIHRLEIQLNRMEHIIEITHPRTSLK